MAGRSWVVCFFVVVACDPTDPPDEPPLPLVETTAVGATPGHLAVDHSGVARYQVPIDVPPGRAGMQPSLTFRYASVGGDGILGRGWSLNGLSGITRCARSIAIDGYRRAVRYDGLDAFCLDGARLVLFAGKEGEDGSEYRTEQESFIRVFLRNAPGIDGPAGFTASLPDGTSRTYGEEGNSAPMLSDEPLVATWRVSSASDRNGNSMSFSYSQPLYPVVGPRGALPESWIESIEYTTSEGGGDLPPLLASRRVAFEVETRSDAFDGFRFGLSWQRTRRIRRVETYLDDVLVRQYRVVYDNTGPTSSSRITSLRECVNAPPSSPSDLSEGLVCRPPTTFEWSLGDETRLYQTQLELWDNTVDVGFAGTPPRFGLAREFTPVLPLDADGDGTDDLAFLNDGTLTLRYGDATAVAPLSTASERPTSITGVDRTFAINREYLKTDHDHDGRDDIALVRTDGSLEVWTSTGADYVPTTTDVRYSPSFRGLIQDPGTGLYHYPPAESGSPTAYVPASFTYLYDADGDGLDDAISCEVYREQECFRLAQQGPNTPFYIDACPGTFTAAFGLAEGGFGAKTDTGVETVCRLNRSDRFRTEIGDFTGDGVADVLFLDTPRPEPGDARRFIPVGNYELLSFDVDSGDFVRIDTEIPYPIHEFPQRLDINGDGLQDLVTWRSERLQDYLSGRQSPQYRQVHLATGGGGFLAPTEGADGTWQQENRSVRYRFSHCTRLRCARRPGSRRYYWVPQPDLGIDLNGDGRGDLLAHTLGEDDLTPSRFALPRGRGWTWPAQALTALVSNGQSFEAEPTSDTLRSAQFTRVRIPGTPGEPPSRTFMPIVDFQMQTMDADGDGALDLVRYQLPTSLDPGTVSGGSLDVLLNRRAQRERVIAVTNGLGARHEIDYAPLADPAVYTPSHDCGWPQTCTADSRWVVSEIRWDGGNAGARRETYKYWGARTDLLGRGWLGFEKRSTTDHSTGEIRTHHFDNRTRDTDVGAYFLARSPVRTTTVVQGEQASTFVLPSSSMLGSERTHTRRIRLRGNRWSVVPTEELTRFYEESGVLVDGEADDPFAGLTVRHASSQRLRYHPSFDLAEFQEVVFEDGARSTIERAFVEPVEHWQLGLLAKSRATDEDKCGRDLVLRFDYDSRGRLSLIERQPDGLAPPRSPEDRLDQVRTLAFGYDPYGNRTDTTETDLEGNVRTTAVDMDAESVYPRRFTNAVGQTSRLEYFPRFGTLYRFTDPNGVNQWTSRDGFGRVRHRERDGAHSSEMTYSGGGAARVFRVRETNSTGFTVSSFLDSLGRLTDQSASAPGDRFAFRRVRYDSSGRVRELSEPFFSGETVYSTRLEYDDVGTLRREPDRLLLVAHCTTDEVPTSVRCSTRKATGTSCRSTHVDAPRRAESQRAEFGDSNIASTGAR